MIMIIIMMMIMMMMMMMIMMMIMIMMILPVVSMPRLAPLSCLTVFLVSQHSAWCRYDTNLCFITITNYITFIITNFDH